MQRASWLQSTRWERIVMLCGALIVFMVCETCSAKTLDLINSCQVSVTSTPV